MKDNNRGSFYPNWRTKKHSLKGSKIKSYSYKDYFYSKESPNIIGDLYDAFLVKMEDLSFNSDHTRNHIIPKYKHYGKFSPLKDVYLDVYSDIEEEGVVSYYFVSDSTDKQDSITVAIYEILPHDMMGENKLIWRERRYGKNTMSQILMDFMLPIYRCIISDVNLTSREMNFWKGIVNDSIGYEDYTAFLYDFNKKEKKYNFELNKTIWEDQNIRLGVEFKK